MKTKIILALIVNLLMIMSIVYAQYLPLPINGKILGENIGGLPIDITNLRTSITKSTITSNSGEYIVDATNFKGVEPRYTFGDTFRIEITSCISNPKCTQEVVYNGEDELFLIFDLTGEDTGGAEPQVCGNGVTESPEQCDDGNTVNGDGCSSICATEVEEEVLEPENKATPTEDKRIATVTAFYGQTIDLKLDDSKLSYLLDGEIYFDGNYYDFKEEYFINAIPKTSIDDEDYATNPYVIFEEGAIEYRFTFDEQIVLSDISKDDPLEITFAGRDIKIVEATADEITVRTGEQVTLSQGETETIFSINTYDIKVSAVTENLVTLEVNGISGSVVIDNSKIINGLDVLVDEIVYQGYAGGIKQATLIVGEKVEDTYHDGDFFDLFIEDDETFEWIINLGGADQYLGFWNVELYESIDEDEDYHPLGIGDTFYLPNNHLEIKFKEVTEVEINDLDFKVKEVNGLDYLYVRGNKENSFSFGTQEFERLYIDTNGIYDEDLVFITNDKVEIGDSDIFLEKGSVKILDITIELDMSDILFKGISFLTQDEVFMDYFGIIFRDPEQAIEDKKGFEVLVPEDRPEVTLEFGRNLPEEAIDDVTGCPICKETTTSDSDDFITTTCPIVDEKICPIIDDKVCEICQEVEDGSNLGAIIITGIITALLGGAGGVYFTRNKVLGRRGGLKIYKNNKGEEVTLHKHPGVRSYHDPKTRHRDVHERHPEGQLFPHYGFSEEKQRYEYKE